MSTNPDPLLANLTDIRAFVAIAEAGSFSQAADKLGTSRAHMSRQLSQLEARLGVQLIIRTTRSQRLTGSGQSFFSRCQVALAQIDDALVDVSTDGELMKGKIVINCVGGILGEQLIGNAIHQFCAEYPEIDIELDFSSERVDLIQSRFDLVVRMGSLEDSRLIGRKMGDVRIGTYATSSYLGKRGELSHPYQLKEHDCLTGSVTKWRYVHKTTGQCVDVDVSGNLQCKNGHVLYQSALLGNGICRLPDLYCIDAVEEGKLQPVFADWEVDKVPLYLLYHRDRHQPARIKALIQHLVETVPPALFGRL